ncbi:TPT-domain-containing protein [Cylindrobasidium torrendii FP15055 ss-10]|uniref:TPT-domain-containing protein n=1 Tax=Cylindrobasidium torrendii FP15055 ss-10 TaxID=1314674 RepID=A0A0D7BFG7_9AGAR|nr:TPT-domain-containing protein [Cylindrobasidium torrendii FP15055 ss-10]
MSTGYFNDKRNSNDWINAAQPTLPLYTHGDGAGFSSVFRTIKAQAVRTFRRGAPLTGAGSSTSATDSSSNVMFILMCSLWYTSSAMSSNTGKIILNQFRYPVTLTFVQFGFVAGYCLLFMSPLVRFSRLRSPSRAIFKSTVPMGLFQVGGHVFSSMAISSIPVSTVHTIKALSPLFTVAAYALLFGVKYSTKTYISLLPLTSGVMLACSFDMSASNIVGLLCAFGSALVFVSSNIFFKKIMPSGQSHSAESKLDKLNLLLYSSGVAFLLMIPIWMTTDLPALLAPQEHVVHPSHSHQHSTMSLVWNFFVNGTVHFGQNLIAFIILSSTSPVTYSIASLIKRVVVICIAIVWFNQAVHPIQAFGIALTFTGLYMYNNAKSDVEMGEKKMRRVEATKALVLPTTTGEATMLTESPLQASGESFGSIAPRRHRAPTLSVRVFPPSTPNIKISSPVDSYPSPPPSIDSPPHRSMAIPTAA